MNGARKGSVCAPDHADVSEVRRAGGGETEGKQGERDGAENSSGSAPNPGAVPVRDEAERRAGGGVALC